MIYLADNWPDEYRNSILTCNIHGNRVNRDVLRRRGSGYVGHHAKDFLFAHDEWFRGLELKYGPDGGVYVTDWSDTGECHERDAHGSHHDSGRIYKVTHGQTKTPANLDLSKRSDQELVQLQLHRNDWYVRHARRILQERFADGADMRPVHQALRRLFAEQAEVTRKLRALWALHVTGGADAEFLQEQLQHPSEYVRGWAIRLLCEDNSPSPAALRRFAALGQSDPSPFVRLHLASIMQRLPLEKRWDIAQALLAHHEDTHDKDLPLMLWYAVEPLVAADANRAVTLAAACQIPIVRTYIARRMADAGKFSPLMDLLRRLESDNPRLEVLTGVYQALEGRKQVGVPEQWPALYAALLKSGSAQLREQATLVSLIFGDPGAVATLRRVAADRTIARQERENALRALTQYRIDGLGALLDRLIDDPQMRAPALRRWPHSTRLTRPNASSRCIRN